MTTFKKILVATDFSDCGQAALETGRALSTACQASLHVLHVVTKPLHEVWTGFIPAAVLVQSVDAVRREAQHRLAETLGDDSEAVIATAWGDDATYEILAYTRRVGADLIVCGTHGRSGWDRFVLGSVAERLVQNASCPVLTVHAGDSVRVAA